MKSKKVTQYSCDHCGKKKYTLHSMIVHEEHCTLNPDRKCRMCQLIGSDNDIKTLLAMIPKDVEEEKALNIFDDVYVEFPEIINRKEILDAFLKMKEAADSCPACILAVVRQLKSKVVFNFNYKKEAMEVFASF